MFFLLCLPHDGRIRIRTSANGYRYEMPKNLRIQIRNNGKIIIFLTSNELTEGKFLPGIKIYVISSQSYDENFLCDNICSASEKKFLQKNLNRWSFTKVFHLVMRIN
jgi:hypothetical protein